MKSNEKRNEFRVTTIFFVTLFLSLAFYFVIYDSIIVTIILWFVSITIGAAIFMIPPPPKPTVAEYFEKTSRFELGLLDQKKLRDSVDFSGLNENGLMAFRQGELVIQFCYHIQHSKVKKTIVSNINCLLKCWIKYNQVKESLDPLSVSLIDQCYNNTSPVLVNQFLESSIINFFNKAAERKTKTAKINQIKQAQVFMDEFIDSFSWVENERTALLRLIEKVQSNKSDHDAPNNDLFVLQLMDEATHRIKEKINELTQRIQLQLSDG